MSSNYQNNWQRRKILYSKEHQEMAFQSVNEIVFKERYARKLILTDDSVLTDFVSCSYLGLDLDDRVIEGASKNIKRCGVTFPAARTRVKAQSFLILEELLNQIFCNNFSVIFNSLHLAHLGFIPLLASGELPSYPIASNGPKFFLDHCVHASLQVNRGLMQQFGEVALMNFNDLNYIEDSLKKAQKDKQTAIFIADSVGSMGGMAHIKEPLQLADKYKGYIYFDDAHGTSVFGVHGCGYVLEQLNCNYHPFLILTSSLAKAFGSVAGVLVLPSKKDADFVKKYSSTYIFGGPPGLPLIDAAIAAAKIHLTDEIHMLQNKLQDNIKFFDEIIYPDITLNYKSTSPIRGLIVGDETKAIQAALAMRKKGIALTTAMYPTVPKDRALLRMALSSAHTKEEIKFACEIINELLNNRITKKNEETRVASTDR